MVIIGPAVAIAYAASCVCQVQGFQSSFAYRPGHGLVRPPSSLHARALLGRFRKKRVVEQERTIGVGDVIPDIDVEVVEFTGDSSTAAPKSIREVLGGGTSVFVGMPGAYTRVCSKEHMPGYLSAAPAFNSLGIDNIVVMTTNDRHVNEAWGTTYGFGSESKPPITIVSDGDGDLAKTMGLAEDMGFGVGVRSKRFAMVVNDGVVSTLLTDEGMDDCDQTSAQNLLRVIRPETSVESSDGDVSSLLMGGAAVVVLGLLFAMNPLGGGGSKPMTATPTPKVQVQSPNVQKSKSFSLLNDYL